MMYQLQNHFMRNSSDLKSSVALLAPIMFMCFIPATGQATRSVVAKDLVGKIFWTKSLVPTMSTCEIRIAHDELSGNKAYCEFVDHLPIGSKLQVISVTRKGNGLSLRFAKTAPTIFSRYL